ncbi:hypothetical protein VTL71DRAFT_1382 [Oculimacula yallundae]|uniref:DUF6594 domain-containing protein n=1 Tax=Oculimacula yallundae TaxID=86028 RepID=A0ABR4CAI4_9HELO
MPQDSSSTLRRTVSRASASAAMIDPYDQAEQGFQAGHGLGDAQPPLDRRQTVSSRSALRSSDSALAETTRGLFELDAYNGARIQTPGRVPVVMTVPLSWTSRFLNYITSVAVNQQQSSVDPLDAYKAGYDRFKYQSQSYEDHPDGWPRLAAFMESSDTFGMSRKFGELHARLLALHMSNITDKESELAKLDHSDASGGEATEWRLKNRYHHDGLDTTKRDLIISIEKELLEYGNAPLCHPFRLPKLKPLLTYYFADKLLLNISALKSLSQTSMKDHDGLFKWIWKHKPLDNDEFDWIFHPDDFVSHVPSKRNPFEEFILRHIRNCPNTLLKGIFKPSKQSLRTKDSMVEYYCTYRISIFARFMVVFCAVLVLLIPVILFLLTSMSRSCMVVVVLGFLFIFSAMISLLTDASVKEVFVGTATYCAVLVTFLGNLQNSSGGS